MNLVVDIGNSLVKIGEFNNNSLVNTHFFESIDKFTVYLKHHKFERIIVSSVSQFPKHLFNGENVLQFSSETPIPINNKYSTPHTLGLDRLAAVVGAHKLFPQQNCLIIDCGTCITFDCLTNQGEYLGGAISPGLKMKFKALNNFTANLPLIDGLNEVDLVGTSTETCITSGVVNGTIAEISGIIQKYRNIYDNLAPVFCGGDAPFIFKQLNEEYYLEKNLVLIGLNEVLNFND